MKILKSHIRRWGFKQRLYEIQCRLKEVKEDLELSNMGLTEGKVDEVLQIVDYWMGHMEGGVKKKVVDNGGRKKGVNLWTE